MSYIDEIAGAIRCLIPPALVPEGGTTVLFRMYALLALAKGEHVVLEDVHDGWAAWMSGLDPEHRSLRPMGELARDARESDLPFCCVIFRIWLRDLPYLAAIHSVARERGLGTLTRMHAFGARRVIPG